MPIMFSEILGMAISLTPTAPPLDMTDQPVPPNQHFPPSYEEVMAQNRLAICCYRCREEPPPYDGCRHPTAPPAESDDETDPTHKSCDNSDTESDNNNSELTTKQKQIKRTLKVASFTVGLPFKILYEVTRTRDPYHKDNDKGHLCSSLAKKICR